MIRPSSIFKELRFLGSLLMCLGIKDKGSNTMSLVVRNGG